MPLINCEDFPDRATSTSQLRNDFSGLQLSLKESKIFTRKELMMAQCMYCHNTTELYDNEQPICLACSDAGENSLPAYCSEEHPAVSTSISATNQPLPRIYR
jgi:hypothetical protein